MNVKWLGPCILTLGTLAGCDAGEAKSSSASTGAGAGGAGGSATTTTTSATSGSTGTTGAGGSVPSPMSGLPVPPGADNQPKPSGAAGGLQVLSWAGFTSAITYTFDDAQPSQIYNWLPNDAGIGLKATGVRGTFYLNTANQSWETDFDATWKDALASGWELGNHTVHHCYSSLAAATAHGSAVQCPNGTTFSNLDEEFDDVTTYITGTSDQPAVWTGAYPFGDTGYEATASSRFFLARGIPSGGTATANTIMPNDATDPHNLPCVAAVGGEPASTFSGYIDSGHTQKSWMIFLFHTIAPDDGQDWYAEVDIGTITGSMAHATSLPDVWTDTLASVGSYWLGEKLLTSATQTKSGGATTWAWTLPAHFPPNKFVRVTVTGGTLTQNGKPLTWDPHGYYEVSLAAGSLQLSP